MKWLRIILLLFFSSLTVILDTSFFSFFEIEGATILSSFALMVVFMLSGHQRDLLALSFLIAINLSILSSVPDWFISIGFIILPSIFAYVKSAYLPDTSLFVSSLFVCLVSLTFELLLLVGTRSWGFGAVSTLGYFVLLNASFSIICYSLARKIKENFMIGRIKFNS